MVAAACDCGCSEQGSLVAQAAELAAITPLEVWTWIICPDLVMDTFKVAAAFLSPVVQERHMHSDGLGVGVHVRMCGRWQEAGAGECLQCCLGVEFKYDFVV